MNYLKLELIFSKIIDKSLYQKLLCIVLELLFKFYKSKQMVKSGSKTQLYC